MILLFVQNVIVSKKYVPKSLKNVACFCGRRKNMFLLCGLVPCQFPIFKDKLFKQTFLER
jgi:hypothetical protein